MKKQFKLISKSILLSVVSSTMISSGLILSSCVNKKDDNENNDNVVETPNGEIKIEDQSPTSNEVSSDSTLTLYVNVTSNKPVKYQWYVNKNNNNNIWNVIEGANQSSYDITSDLMQNVTTSTVWKYKAEIYDANDENVKLTSKIYSVNIKPQQTAPSPEPIPPINPEPNPNPSPSPTPPPISPEPSPDDSPATSINSGSIKLKDIGRLLPSQYLSDVSNLVLNEDLIIKSFNLNNIKNISYKVIELNDKYGTLSILMNYTENNVYKNYRFNFKNLLYLDNNSYHFEFENATSILNLSAQEVASKSINSNEAFKELIEYLEDYKIYFKFKIKGIELPLKYLNINQVKIDGFGTNWFTNNNKLILTFTLQNPTINYYVKTVNGNVELNNFNYPTNLTKKVNMEFFSAADYLLNIITNNEKYATNEYASYYYYDITENNAEKAQLKISNNSWLSNVKTELIYENVTYVYKPLINTNGITKLENGSLSIDLKVECVSNSTHVSSQTSKNITITGFSSYNQNNLFANNNDLDGKFSLWCNPLNYDNNISKLKSVKNKIVKKIESITDPNAIVIFKNSEVPISIISILTKNLICKFSNMELIESDNKDYYYNDLAAIQKFIIDNNDTLLRYDKKNDVFQLAITNFSILGVGVNDDNYATNDRDMIVNITHLGISLSKLTNT